ncbi:hypothetical protein ABPG74_008027 [Tetrahymena malaccensis]
MRILAFAYLVLIYLSFANCQQAPPNPSWVKQAAATKYTQCFQQLTPPTCSTGNSATCTTAYNNYISCLACSSSNSNLSSLKTCYKTCGTAFMADQTIQNDSSVTLYVNGMNTCVVYLDSILLSISACIFSFLLLLL